MPPGNSYMAHLINDAGGNYFYDSRPQATITRDNSAEVFDQRTVYWKNYRVGGVPQTAVSVGLKYNSPKFWFVGVNANWFDDIYLGAKVAMT